MSTEFLVIVGVLGVAAAYLIYIYNQLVALRLRTENGFSQIDVQLKRRYDLIPNLVETAKGYMAHERETLDAVVQARNAASAILNKMTPDQLSNAGSMGELAGAEATLGSALRGFQVAVEAYPDLKASTNIAQLSEELTSTENKISFARQAFNDAVNTYNALRLSFPTILFASMLGHREDIPFLNFDDDAIQEAPSISF